MKYLFLFFALIQSLCFANSVDMVVFSYDRPMQLYAFLESVEHYITGINKIHVIYRASNDQFLKAYKELCYRFKEAQFHRQLEPYDDFKTKLLTCIYKKKSPCEYVIFGVDDIIVTDFVDLDECVKALKETKAWGFFLRLGKNIDYTYTMKLKSPPPYGRNLKYEMFFWKFSDGVGDWCYPNSLDMTVYRKKDLETFFTTAEYTHPSWLEGRWSEIADSKKHGLCFQHSKIVNLPLNLVTTFQSVCAHSYSVADLFEKFNEGLKIDIKQFYRINNRSPHEEYTLIFISRT